MYYRHAKKEEKTYSIDRFTFDFYFLPCAELYQKIILSLNAQEVKNRQSMSVQHFTTTKFQFLKTIYQFGHLHVEVWEEQCFARITKFANGDSGKEFAGTVSVPTNQQVRLRLDFNPNKCGENPVLAALMEWLSETDIDYVFSVPRIDYALDINGKLLDFYVLSRKTETFFSTTRYYGARGTSGRLRVYDKRQEQKDKERVDIGRDLVRFEWEQRGNRDFQFKFDTIARFMPAGDSLMAPIFRYVSPEYINNALGALDKRTRKKVKDQCFQHIAFDPSVFEMLLVAYFIDFGLPMERRRDWDKQFSDVDIENLA